MRSTLAFLLIAFLLMVTPVLSQEGRGVIVETSRFAIESIGPLNPLLCHDGDCAHITDLLFPSLFAVDPQSGQVIDAAPGNNGLVVDTSPPTEAVHRLHLRDDLRWTDGTPVTAYDVFFSYAALTSEYIDSPYSQQVESQIVTMRPADAATLDVIFTTPGCASLSRANFPIIPAHVFEPDFQEAVLTVMEENEIDRWQHAWWGSYPREQFGNLYNQPFNEEPTVTAGPFVFDSRLPFEEIRLKTPDGALAYILRNPPPNLTPLDAFLAGQSNLLDDIPLSRRADLLTVTGIQIERVPTNEWIAIALNLANPLIPFGALNEQGEPLDQGVHPIFGDPRVRQALQMGIDVQTILDTVRLGEGLPLASSLPPSSWGVNLDLTPVTYSPVEAARLLESAGWKDVNRDGVRECVGCEHAFGGSSLSFTLEMSDDAELNLVGTLVQRQLAQIGVNVQLSSSSSDWARMQRFDAFLNRWTQDSDPDQSALWTRRADLPERGQNMTSYYNLRVEELLDEALHTPQCSIQERGPLYHEIQAILHEDQPFLWLYSPTEMVAVRGVLNFDPLPGELLWNIRDWVVTP
jgi:peptide/nickel transport system substrate-binding protein